MAAALMRHVLDEPIPPSLPIGRGAVLLVRGRMVAPAPRVREFVVRLDDDEQRFDARGERIFLPVVVDAARADTRARLRIAARTRGGEQRLVDQRIELLPAARNPIAIDTPIAICLATYNPDPALLARQLESLRAQTRRDWTCIIHDDGSRLERWAAIEELARSDERFRVFRSERNRGFYRNFEAALALVPSTTPYVALCDQDDRWEPDKLAATIAALDADPAAQLAYCDMRIVDRAGRVLAPTFWSRRRNNYRTFDTQLFVNSVTGAASVFRGRLLDALLPFPVAHGRMFHDHFIACAAMLAGGVAFVDRALYDYTQHGGNELGFGDFRALTPAQALGRHLRHAAEMLLKPGKLIENTRDMLAVYDSDYRRLQIIATVLGLRFPVLGREEHAALSLFDGRLVNAARLALSRHWQILRRGDTTDMMEFRLGTSVLVHKILGAPLFPRAALHSDSP